MPLRLAGACWKAAAEKVQPVRRTAHYNSKMLQLFNSLTGRKEHFKELVAGHVDMYVCGDTVYDFCHIGHARSKIVFDVVRRYLVYRGYRVRFVRNITDIDDRIIQRAAQNGESWTAL